MEERSPARNVPKSGLLTLSKWVGGGGGGGGGGLQIVTNSFYPVEE